MQARIRHVIFDRDGVLNVEAADGGWIRTWNEWRWLPGVLGSLARLHTAGLCLSIATNQSGVGRGALARAALDALHARMLEEAAQAGGAIDHLFVCPHAPADGCECRKPKPGMLLDALAASGIARDATLLLGDSRRDLEAAAAAGMAAALVRTGKGARTEAALAPSDTPVFDDVRAFTSALLTHPIAFAGAQRA